MRSVVGGRSSLRRVVDRVDLRRGRFGFVLLGGVIGCLMVLPFQGAETGTMNSTFSEVTFAFRTTPFAMTVSILFAAGLGIVGGVLPAWRAARMTPTQALRRG